jgi:transketolase
MSLRRHFQANSAAGGSGDFGSEVRQERASGRATEGGSNAAAWRRRARLRLLQMHYERRVGHLGGNLSALDMLLSLYHDVMHADDLFVLSKGHAAGALYVTLWTRGRLTDADLAQFHGDGTRLSGHPPAQGIDEILFATGSLGHGLGLAAGLALGKRFQQRPGRVYCLTSDGEWNEGSTWESLIFARHHRLSNLTVVVDLNGLQGFGATREVADLSPLSDRLRAFGVATVEIDGHDLEAVAGALPMSSASGPTFIVARTHKGCGVSFMQDRMEWHYLPMTAEQYARAVEEVGTS